uniref:Uncharacterized protein n=1 Tax=Panagrolaimus superbus TaxID=310955 RepID=A0A914Y372_9BILA
MALPHPPPPNALPEVPVKPLGPILSRSMVDIRMDIAELHSKGSRANSVIELTSTPSDAILIRTNQIDEELKFIDEAVEEEEEETADIFEN